MQPQFLLSLFFLKPNKICYSLLKQLHECLYTVDNGGHLHGVLMCLVLLQWRVLQKISFDSRFQFLKIRLGSSVVSGNLDWNQQLIIKLPSGQSQLQSFYFKELLFFNISSSGSTHKWNLESDFESSSSNTYIPVPVLELVPKPQFQFGFSQWKPKQVLLTLPTK